MLKFLCQLAGKAAFSNILKIFSNGDKLLHLVHFPKKKKKNVAESVKYFWSCAFGKNPVQLFT